MVKIFHNYANWVILCNCFEELGQLRICDMIYNVCGKLIVLQISSSVVEFITYNIPHLLETNLSKPKLLREKSMQLQCYVSS